jgi:S-adenosyl-L-methionine hydrolase (adenosine-forming)
MRRVTLLTDFGTADGYVAALKGVIAAIAPAALVEDAAHDIAAGDIHGAAWALAGYWRLYPPGTVHLAVVDPGVGSSRAALALHVDGRFLVGPDNGVFTHVLHGAADASVVSITASAFIRASVSATFHGRDIFAPAAAHLAAGVPLDRLGPAVHEPVLLPLAAARRSEGVATGTVVHVDRFGNLITNIPAAWVAGGAAVRIGGRVVPLRRTYADAAPGDLLALEGSRGMLEVAVRDGSALVVLGAAAGTAVSAG